MQTKGDWWCENDCFDLVARRAPGAEMKGNIAAITCDWTANENVLSYEEMGGALPDGWRDI